MNLTSIITKAIDQIDHEQALNREIYTHPISEVENEFLLILKPELFVDYSLPHLDSILNFILEKLNAFGLHVSNARIINANYLKTYNVMAQHYGVINAAARNFHDQITLEVTSNFKEIYGLKISEAPIFGALEILNDGQMEAATLTELWKTCEIKRLAGGIYSGKVKHKGSDLYIVNGFHPPQLDHFIAENRMIVTMDIAGNTSWEMARNELIGNTYPEKASPESIRGTLFQKYDKFGFDQVSYVLNSVHLSAGPLEGLLELQRFNSAFELNQKAEVTQFVFGKLLQENFNPQQIETILTNPAVTFNEKPISLFDLTEGKNSGVAIELIRKTI
ncbi:MAG: hypothetical protein ACERKD_05275 [Prolixibacteraceae bacterium]